MMEKVLQLSSKSGNFDALFCIGHFFGTGNELQPYIEGKSKSALPTYFITKNEETKFLPSNIADSGEVAPNLTYLGTCGIREIQGLSVAYFNGAAQSNESVDFDEEKVSVLRSRAKSPTFRGADLLLTNHWSKGVLNHLTDVSIIGLPTLQIETFGAQIISTLANELSPRYHFASSPSHLVFERIPYTNTEGRHVTRFLGLGEAFNSKKAKFMYAFQIAPLTSLPAAEVQIVPPGSTSSPFYLFALERTEVIPSDRKRKYEELERLDAKSGNQSFFYPSRAARGQQYPARQNERQNEHHGKYDHQDRKLVHQERREKEFQSENPRNYKTSRFKRNDPQMEKKIHPLMQRSGCWFCLSNTVVEEHLVVAVGDVNYLAMAKGGLNKEHVLIIPIAHITSLDKVEKEGEEEINRFKGALVECFESKGLEMVFWERKLETASNDKNHGHLQAIALPKAVMSNFYPLLLMVKHCGLELVELKEGETAGKVAGNLPYLFFDLPAESPLLEDIKGVTADGDVKLHRKRLIAVIGEGKRVPLQLPRRMIAKAMNEAEREDWKHCTLSKADEEHACSEFKHQFGPFDFTLE